MADGTIIDPSQRLDASASEVAFEWISKRNCALRPMQLAVLLAVPAAASLTIASLFTALGAWWILVFSVIEVLGLVAAYLVYARHAGAYERLLILPDRLVLEWDSGSATARQEMRPGSVRIEFPCARIPGFGAEGSVVIHGGGRSFALGRYAAAPERAALAARIRRELRLLRPGSG